jgi:outer membrane protein assembly factor BamE (lipoprotein component of BamABCDE complex)
MSNRKMGVGRWLVILGLLGPLAAGCAIKVGAKFDSSEVAKITAGQTTEVQVREMLGEPTSEGLKDGKPLWTYLHARVPILGGTARGTVVSIEFNNEGVVQSYSYIPY